MKISQHIYVYMYVDKLQFIIQCGRYSRSVCAERKKAAKSQSIHQPNTRPPTRAGVFQRRRLMVNTRLQNFFPRQLYSLLRFVQHHWLPK
jgi:hypothetical protein